MSIVSDLVVWRSATLKKMSGANTKFYRSMTQLLYLVAIFPVCFLLMPRVTPALIMVVILFCLYTAALFLLIWLEEDQNWAIFYMIITIFTYMSVMCFFVH
jgi:hypothetical protein